MLRPRPPALTPGTAPAFCALLPLLLAPGAAQASCIGRHAQIPEALETLAFADPAAAVTQIDELLARESVAAAANTAPASDAVARRATLHALSAEALRQLGFTDRGRAAVAAGAALWDLRTRSPLSVRLRNIAALHAIGEGPLDSALADLDTLLSEYADDPRAVACTQRDRGWLRFRAGQFEGALRDLSEARTQLAALGLEREAKVATGRLAEVYRAAREYDEGEALLRETIVWFRRERAWVRLATAHDRLGLLYRDVERFDDALAQFRETRRLSELARDPLGVAYASLRTCNVEIERRHFDAARASCTQAARELANAGPIDHFDARVLAQLLGRIELGTAHPAQALRHFDVALAPPDSLERSLALRVLGWRSEAREALGDHRGALADARAYQHGLRELDAVTTRNRVSVVALRGTLERERERSLRLREERDALAAEAAEDRRQRNLVIVASVLGLGFALLALHAWQRRRVAETARSGAERRLEELGRLSVGIAHDFNNLMTVVQQAAGQLARHPAIALDAAAQGLIGATRDAARTGGEITRLLLAFGRQQALQPETFELGAFLGSQRTLLAEAAGSDARVGIEARDLALYVHLDPSQLVSALVNLLANAREATPDGERTEVMIRAGRDAEVEPRSGANWIRVEVSDRGRGMTPEVLARATEPFFSTKTPTEGGGLGLSAVDGFVRQSGGRLSLVSEPGRGTTVAMLFPAAKSLAVPVGPGSPAGI